MLRKDKKPLWTELRRLEKLALTKIRDEAAEKRKRVRQERPFSTWNDFLKFQAKQGQETALDVLRSRHRPEKQDTQKPQTPSKGKPNLPIVEEMRALFNHPDSPFKSLVAMKYTIDAKGTVIFTLPSGGTIRDNGQTIHFSVWDKNAKILAALLADKRYKQNDKLAEMTFK